MSKNNLHYWRGQYFNPQFVNSNNDPFIAPQEPGYPDETIIQYPIEKLNYTEIEEEGGDGGGRGNKCHCIIGSIILMILLGLIIYCYY